MYQEFIPYKQALELKELGFDEKCYGHYDSVGFLNTIEDYARLSANILDMISKEYNSISYMKEICSAPLYQQAFRWFEYKGYRNYVASNQFGGKVNYWFAITPPEELTYSDTKGRTTKEEAELACLKQLIKITKNK